MLVRNENAATAIDPTDGTVYHWEPNGDVEVPSRFANEICAIRDAGFIATADVNRDHSEDLVTVNELRREEGQDPVDGGDKVARPRGRSKSRVPALPSGFTEVDPEVTEPETADDAIIA